MLGEEARHRDAYLTSPRVGPSDVGVTVGRPKGAPPSEPAKVQPTVSVYVTAIVNAKGSPPALPS
jgi:hypothetical protein